jgi:hypothetical protein
LPRQSNEPSCCRIKISRDDLYWAAEKKIISEAQAESLWAGLNDRRKDQPSFNLTHLTYYFGGLLVIGAMSWFMVLGWESWGGGGIMTVSLLYAICFSVAGWNLSMKPEGRIPGGILVTAAVWMAPLVCYGFQRMMGWWPQADPGAYRDYHVWVKGGWVAMEVVTVIAGICAIRLVRFPFITFPIAFALWYLSMDLAPLFIGERSSFTDEREIVSLVFGGVLIWAAYFIDRRSNEDFAFWLYLFGLAAFWGGLSLLDVKSEAVKFLYCLINVGLLFLSVFLRRRVFAVFGSLGVFGYLGHLSYELFKDSLFFPFVLTFLGVLLIWFGRVYQANRRRFEVLVQSLPGSIQRLRPAERI